MATTGQIFAPQAFIQGDRPVHAGDTFGAGAAPAPRDTTPPVISAVSPVSGSQIDRTTPITFSVADAAPGVTVNWGWMKYSNQQHRTLVHDGSGFVYPFASTSSIVDTFADGTLLTVTILPQGGWIADVEELRMRFVDGDGNIDVEI